MMMMPGGGGLVEPSYEAGGPSYPMDLAHWNQQGRRTSTNQMLAENAANQLDVSRECGQSIRC